MQILLFIGYAAVLSFLITRSGFLRSSGLKPSLLVAVFLFFGITGCLHLIIAYHYFPHHGDIWQMYTYSLQLKPAFLHDFPAFAKEFFPATFTGNIFSPNSGWTAFQGQALVLLHLVFNFISFDNIYINTLLFCFMMFWGNVAFYKVLLSRYPGMYCISFFLAFLIPSMIFWTSVIHKEATLVFSLYWIIYSMQKLFHFTSLQNAQGSKKRFSHHGTYGSVIKYSVIILASVFVIFITRKILLITLLPALLYWYLAEKSSFKPFYILAAMLLIPAAAIVLLNLFGQPFNAIDQVYQRQQEFLQLNGRSAITPPQLDHSLARMVRSFPVAVINGLFMPIPGSGGNLIYLIFFAELVAVWMIILWCSFLLVTTTHSPADAFSMGFLIFALTSCILIGYIVPFIGAIVRYRSIYYPFFLLPFVPALKNLSFVQRLNKVF